MKINRRFQKKNKVLDIVFVGTSNDNSDYSSLMELEEFYNNNFNSDIMFNVNQIRNIFNNYDEEFLSIAFYKPNEKRKIEFVNKEIYTYEYSHCNIKNRQFDTIEYSKYYGLRINIRGRNYKSFNNICSNLLNKINKCNNSDKPKQKSISYKI